VHAPQRVRAQGGQAALEWTGVLLLVALIVAMVASVAGPAIAGPIAREVQSIFGGGQGSVTGGAPFSAYLPPGGVATLRDSHGNVWTWETSGPQGPHWLVTGPHGQVSEVSPQGTLLSGAPLGAIAFPIVKITRQGNEVVVETLDGKVYVLQNSPDAGPDQQDVQDVADQILQTRDGVSNVSFVQRSLAEPRPDIVTYNSLKPGSPLNFVEVKNLSVDDDGQVNAFTGAGNVLDAIRRQGADEVVVVLDTPPDPNSVLSLVQRTNTLLASKGISGKVTIAVRESGDIGLGPLHEAWTGELGAGVPSDDVDSLDAGEAAAQEDQPGDDQAGDPDPGNPALGGGDGDGGDGGDAIGAP
jgi:hypothetical protein